jgi:3-oxoacyl-[acyl-carrier-protein] synthase II
MAAAIQAVADSGLPTGEALDDELATRIGCNIGSGIGGLPMIEQTHAELTNRGPRRISPFFVPASIINMISGHVSIKLVSRAPTWPWSQPVPPGLHAIGCRRA